MSSLSYSRSHKIQTNFMELKLKSLKFTRILIAFEIADSTYLIGLKKKFWLAIAKVVYGEKHIEIKHCNIMFLILLKNKMFITGKYM